ncbi:MAG: hypothetical protein IPH44_31910 [Myxococcales bacterium]|nr:hypothetical protein [Myxococcales bacterium]MBK7194220.1 hypothetical protein [Myxococcales bacterium]
MRLALVLAALALAPSLTAADPHPMSSGATPAPTTDAQVAMSAETLAIAIDQRAATVKAAVTLANPGPATKLVVGFPCAVGGDAGAIDVPCKIPLTVTVGGKRVKATKRKTSKTVQHWTWPVKLAAGASVELVVSYRAPLVNERYEVPAYGMGLFTYRLTTGARWAGPIGTLRITVDHMHDALLFVAPAGGVRTPGRITWQLDGAEPTEEVILIPAPMAGNRLAQQIGGRTAAEAAARVAAGDYRRADVEAAIAALRAGDAELDQWLPTISRVAGLATPATDRARATIAESIAVLERMAANAQR